MFGFNARKVGYLAEEKAAKYLKRLGYSIISKNFTIRGGEVDIIAKDKEVLVFVEVKMRTSSEYGLATEAITSWKLKSLQKTALFFIQKTKWGDRPYRFDLLAIDTVGREQKFELLKNITF